MPLLRTSLLKSEPAGVLRSLDELFALANAMEQEAANKYAELAEEMRRQNRSELASVFADLEAAEREHVDSVTAWSQSRRGKAPDPALVRWEAPETFDADTTAEIKSSRRMTPYRALSMAVRNEERAFAFWSYVAGFAEDPEIKKSAEVDGAGGTWACRHLAKGASPRLSQRAWRDACGTRGQRRGRPGRCRGPGTSLGCTSGRSRGSCRGRIVRPRARASSGGDRHVG